MIKVWTEGGSVTIGTVSTCFSRTKPAEWAPSDPSVWLHWSVSGRDCRPSKGLSWSKMMDTALSSIISFDTLSPLWCTGRLHVLIDSTDLHYIRSLFFFVKVTDGFDIFPPLLKIQSVTESIWLMLLLTPRSFKLKLQCRKGEELIFLHKQKFYFLTLWITKKGKKAFHFKMGNKWISYNCDWRIEFKESINKSLYF